MGNKEHFFKDMSDYEEESSLNKQIESFADRDFRKSSMEPQTLKSFFDITLDENKNYKAKELL